MVIAAAAIDGVSAGAGIDRVGSIAAEYRVVAGAAINEESNVRTSGGDTVVTGACIDALEIVGNLATYACGSPVVGAAGVVTVGVPAPAVLIFPVDDTVEGIVGPDSSAARLCASSAAWRAASSAAAFAAASAAAAASAIAFWLA